MSGLDGAGRELAAAKALVRLAPTGEPKQSGAASLRFPASGNWAEGDYYSVVADAAFYMKCGTSAVTAATTDTGPFPAGVHDFALPDACTHVAVIAASGTLVATAWKS